MSAASCDPQHWRGWGEVWGAPRSRNSYEARQAGSSEKCLTEASAGVKSRKRSRLENVPWCVPLGAADTVRKVSVQWRGQAQGWRKVRQKCEVSEDGACGPRFEAWLQREGKGDG